MRNMKRTLLLLSFCVAMPVGSSWAAVVGSTNPADFSVSTVDWCQLGCGAPDGTLASSTLAPTQLWLSSGGDLGFVDVTNLGAFPNNFLYNLVAGPDPTPAPAPPNLWISGFDQGMGLVYNGVLYGNSPASITIGFAQAEIGVGAYIQSDTFGPFTATIELFDNSGNSLGAFTASGSASSVPGTALFLGAASVSGPVTFATFTATGGGGAGVEPDFAIGTMNLGLGCRGDGEGEADDFCTEFEDDTLPEPASLLLMTPALLGLIAFTRRRRG